MPQDGTARRHLSTPAQHSVSAAPASTAIAPAPAGPASPIEDRAWLSSGQWVTREQAKDLASRSIDVIKRAIRAALEAGEELAWREGPNRTKYYFLDHLIALGIVPANAVPAGLTAPETAELIQARAQFSSLNAQVAALRAQVTAQDDLIAVLNKQLEKKDRLLFSLATTNESLASRHTPGHNP